MTLAELAADQNKRNWKWFPNLAEDLQHHVLGLCGEAGEVANLVKKWDRGDFDMDEKYVIDGKGNTESMREVIGEEVIDVIIYALSICAILGVNPDEILEKKNDFNATRFGAWVTSVDDSEGDTVRT